MGLVSWMFYYFVSTCVACFVVACVLASDEIFYFYKFSIFQSNINKWVCVVYERHFFFFSAGWFDSLPMISYVRGYNCVRFKTVLCVRKWCHSSIHPILYQKASILMSRAASYKGENSFVPLSHSFEYFNTSNRTQISEQSAHNKRNFCLPHFPPVCVPALNFGFARMGFSGILFTLFSKVNFREQVSQKR